MIEKQEKVKETKNKNNTKSKRIHKMQKKGYVSFLVRILIPLFIVGVIALFACTTILLNRIAMDIPIAQDIISQMDHNIENVNELYEAGVLNEENDYFTVDKDALYLQRIRFVLGIRTSIFGDIASASIYDTNGKKIISSDSRVFIIVKLNDEEKYFFGCDPKKFHAKTCRLMESDSNINSYYSVELKDVYVKGAEFIPGEYVLNEVRQLDKTVIQTFPGPKEIPDGYNHIIFDKNIRLAIGPIFLGSDISPEQRGNRQVLSTLFDVLGELNDSTLREYKMNGQGYTEAAKKISLKIIPSVLENSDAQTYKENQSTTDNQHSIKKCILVVNTSTNTLDMVKPYVIIAWIIGLAIILIISLLIARINYRDYKERYNMEQYRRNMTDTLAHDLKSPLMAISGYAESMKADVNPEKREYYLDSVLHTTKYMNSIISNMFELEKLEDMNIVLNKSQVNLYEMTKEVAEEFDVIITDKKITLSIEGEAYILADSGYMKRLFENLIGNAVKYTPNEEVIHVFLSNKGIRVLNTGISIEPNLLSRMKEPFVKGCHERSNESGSGLGLTIVEQIAEMHNMKFQLYSENNTVEARIDF